MRMPPHDFKPSPGSVIYNGQPVRSDHAATCDEWATYLAAVAFPRLPMLVCGGTMTDDTGIGWRSTTDVWALNPTVTIPVVIPPFTKYLQVGAMVTGYGEIRFTGPNQANNNMITLKSPDKGHGKAQTVALWCDPPGPTGDGVNRPLIVGPTSGSLLGYKLPTLQELVIQWRTLHGDWDLTVRNIMIRPWPIPAGADMDGYSTSDGGNTL